jgi:copper resistance protein D
VLEPAVVVLRFVQYGGAAILFGTPLFLLYGFRGGGRPVQDLGWPKRVLAAAAVALLLGSLFGVVAQTAVMAGSIAEGLKPASLAFVLEGSALGRAALVRAACALLSAIAVMVLVAGPRLWLLLGGLGAVACASLAWMGHAAATEGAAAGVHLVSDVVHVLAAGVWIGALVGFAGLLLQRSPSAAGAMLTARALRGFSGVGTVVVAALVATGLVNSWILVGPSRLEGLWTTPYGLVLCAKLATFAAMLGLAAANRMLLTPALLRALEQGAQPADSLARLRSSIALETLAGALVLMLVAWLGTLAPVAAQ